MPSLEVVIIHTCSNRVFWRVVQSTGANIKVWVDARNYKGYITKVCWTCKREHSIAGWQHHVLTGMFQPRRALHIIPQWKPRAHTHQIHSLERLHLWWSPCPETFRFSRTTAPVQQYAGCCQTGFLHIVLQPEKDKSLCGVITSSSAQL